MLVVLGRETVGRMHDVRTAEIADGIFQFTTYFDAIDFGVNQYLVRGDEPMLFHTGMRSQFDSVSVAVATVVPLSSLRWIGFGHVEADECGSLNQWLSVPPAAIPVTSAIGCMVSVADLADRPPRPLADGEVLEIGGPRLLWIDTPHLPHGWEAGHLHDETTATIFCGDLFSQWGRYPASTSEDIAVPGVADDPAYSLAPSSPALLRRLGALGARDARPDARAGFRRRRTRRTRRTRRPVRSAPSARRRSAARTPIERLASAATETPLSAQSDQETTVPIQRLEGLHADAAAATLGEAFFDDPLLQIVAPDEVTRRRWAPWFMSLPLQYGLR